MVVVPVQLEENVIYVVQAFHPCYFIRCDSSEFERENRRKLLQEILRVVCEPYGIWKANAELEQRFLEHSDVVFEQVTWLAEQNAQLIREYLDFTSKLLHRLEQLNL